MDEPIYLDNQATTRLDPRVLEAMLPFLRGEYGNAASSSHPYGKRAAAAVEKARAQVAGVLGALPSEIVFTSGATESVNTAVKGAIAAAGEGRDHVVSSTIEHKAGLDACKRLEAERRKYAHLPAPTPGARVTLVGVDAEGQLRQEELDRAIDGRTALVTVMLANNEIGVVQPVGELALRVKASGALFHSDVAQALGKIPVDVNALGLDLASLSGHKIYGPKGVGALFVREAVLPRLASLLDGGGQERGLRPGTLNVPGIVGLGAAAAICEAELASEATRVRALRERFWAALTAAVDGLILNGSAEHRLPGSVSVVVRHVDARRLMQETPGVAMSAGSACSSQSVEVSHVLRAIGRGQDAARSTIRVGIGRFNTEAEIDAAGAQLIATIQRLRAKAGLG
jgi:cysteine desulfurase